MQAPKQVCVLVKRTPLQPHRNFPQHRYHRIAVAVRAFDQDQFACPNLIAA